MLFLETSVSAKSKKYMTATKEFEAEKFIYGLQQELQGPLPGTDAQFQMAPRPRSGAEKFNAPDPNARRGGVLVLFYPHKNQLHLPLILRPTYDGVHSGQVGFPGGGYEEVDANITETALREAYEEVGIEPESVQILGQLTPVFVNVSNFVVQPTVGWVDARPTFKLDSYEVEQLIEVPLAELQDEQNVYEEEWTLRTRVAQVPFYKIQGQTIWGATAMMLSELLSLNSISRQSG